MPGLVALNLAKDPLKSVSTYEPEKIAVEPQDTVAGQIDAITKADSPLMQAAATKGKQFANRRGVLNSTMAAQASQQAVLDAATPIAQQDAATFYDAKRSNQQAGNTALQFGAGQKNIAESQLAEQGFREGENEKDRALQTNLQGREHQFQAEQNALTRGHQSSLQQGEQAWRSGEAALDRSHQANLQATEQEFNRLMQDDNQTFQAAQNDLDRALQSKQIDASQKNAVMQTQLVSIHAVIMDPNLTPESKRAAIDNIMRSTLETADFMASINISAGNAAAQYGVSTSIGNSVSQLQGTGGQGAATQSQIQSLVAQARLANMSLDQLVDMALTSFPNTSRSQMLSLVTPFWNGTTSTPKPGGAASTGTAAPVTSGGGSTAGSNALANDINIIKSESQAQGKGEIETLKVMKQHLEAAKVDTSDPKAVAKALGITEAQAKKNLDKLA